MIIQTITILILLFVLTFLSTIVFGMAYINMEARKNMKKGYSELEDEVRVLELEVHRYELWIEKDQIKDKYEKHKAAKELARNPPKKEPVKEEPLPDLSPAQIKQIQAMMGKK